MILFHGSNVKVETPKIILSNRTLDFGAGFYTTSSETQAVRWSKIQAYRRKTGIPTVSVFAFEEKDDSLRILRFEQVEKEWLRFVVQNRKGIYSGETYDVVIGPVANDNTMSVINEYMAGGISEETALLLLLPQKLDDQYAFLTQKGLDSLRYLEVKQYD